MKRPAALAFALLLAGCDDPTVITHVDKRDHMKLSDLWAMQSDGGIPVEIHGAPFASVPDAELAASLRPPSGSAQEVRFFARPVGQGHGGHDWRLVLHFNPQGPPNSVHDCRMQAEARTKPPADRGYEVNATFCQGESWQAHGFMRALETEEGDLEAFSRAMRVLISEMFREEPGADR